MVHGECTSLGQPVRERRRGVEVTVGDDDAGAVVGEQLGGGGTDPGRRPR